MYLISRSVGLESGGIVTIVTSVTTVIIADPQAWSREDVSQLSQLLLLSLLQTRGPGAGRMYHNCHYCYYYHYFRPPGLGPGRMYHNCHYHHYFHYFRPAGLEPGGCITIVTTVTTVIIADLEQGRCPTIIPTVIIADPRAWSREDVSVWLDFTVRRNGLPFITAQR